MEKHIVCLGGGTGTFMVLSGLKKYPVRLSAIVSMADDGGSSGRLRDELGILPPGDVRQCLVALSEESLLLRKLFNYRFRKGALSGHSFGNLFMAALEKITGSFDRAVQEISKILKIKGEVIPVTLNKVWLRAKLENNIELKGENEINNSPLLSKFKVKKLFLRPKARANPKAILAIKKADLIVLGPGNLYCSILPNFLPEGIVPALSKSKAKKIYICNLMTKYGHTDGFSVEDFLKIIESYLGRGVIDYVIFNKKRPSAKFLKKYAAEGEFIDFNQDLLKKKRFIGANLINSKIYKPDPGDIFLKRTFIRHDPDKLAKLIMKLLPR